MTLEIASQRRIANPPSSSTAEVQRDAPDLVPLLTQQPQHLRLYTIFSPHFDTLTEIYNLIGKAKPLAVARCLSISGVQSVVRFCSEHAAGKDRRPSQIPLVIRSGGHDMFMRSLVAHSLMLDVRALDSITISPDRKSATIGGGVTSGDLVGFLDERELITPIGYCTTVGHVGWMTGGGYGVLAGAYGLGVDQILGAKLVTARGAIIDTDDDPELLWAMRGAGNGNFGVVVEMRVKVYERPAMLGGMIAFPASETDKAMLGLQRLIESGGNPDNFSGDCTIAQLPGIGPAFLVLFAWVERVSKGEDSLADGMEWLKKCEELGSVMVNTVTETTFSAFMGSLGPLTSVPMRSKLRSFNVSRFSPELATIWVRNPVPEGVSMVVAHNSHGAATFPHPIHSKDPTLKFSCMPIRHPHLIIAMTGGVLPVLKDDGSEDVDATLANFEKVTDWADTIAKEMVEAGIALPRTYVSWTPNEDSDTVTLYGEETTDRLKKLKAIYDGDNLFSSAYPDLR